MSDVSFRERVYAVVGKIPPGKVMSYGTVAFFAGKPRAARAVGHFLHNNPNPSEIPCHRVVFRDGSLTPGYAFGGEDVQRGMLISEGAEFLPDGKVDMVKCSFSDD